MTGIRSSRLIRGRQSRPRLIKMLRPRSAALVHNAFVTHGFASIQFDFGYPWWLSYGQVVVLLPGLLLLSVVSDCE